MSARTELADLLTDLLPDDLKVLLYPRDIDPPAATTVMLRLDEVRPSRAGAGALEHDFALLIIAKQSASGPSDDELDAALADVLHAISGPGNGISWTRATRATFNDRYPAYEVETTITTSKES